MVSCIQFLLKNSIYCGLIRFNGEYYRGVHGPTISKKLFGSVQQVTSNRWKKKRKQKCGEKYLREENLIEQMKEVIQKVSLSDDWANNMLVEIDKEREQAKKETKRK